MNVRKMRGLLRRAERVLGLLEGTRHGHRRRYYGRRRRGLRRRVEEEALRRILRRMR